MFSGCRRGCTFDVCAREGSWRTFVGVVKQETGGVDLARANLERPQPRATSRTALEVPRRPAQP